MIAALGRLAWIPLKHGLIILFIAIISFGVVIYEFPKLGKEPNMAPVALAIWGVSLVFFMFCYERWWVAAELKSQYKPIVTRVL